jgi:hypothetical protein
LWTWRGHRHLPLGGAACRRIRTLDLFSAIDEQVGEKGKKAVYYVYYVPNSPYNLLRSLHAVSAYLYPIVQPQYKARKGDPKPLKNIAFTILFLSPDQETCPGCFTHP